MNESNKCAEDMELSLNTYQKQMKKKVISIDDITKCKHLLVYHN